MREIEFRGQQINTKQWVYGYLYRNKGLYVICENIRYAEEEPIFSDSVGQYTGLKDKNGKKIFEGDILLRKSGQFESIVLVKWGKVEFSFLYKSRYDGKIRKGKWTRGTYQGLDGYAEVIGNIYNNPELLEEEL